ncbi:hypothetical protein [uncultured Winogradskyella sp.]|uniref:hypothetical protein n=1 Tax=uncultured Winogradskyella sp. TaxID=395353 RepID=UPI0030D9423D|tara:strand:- start:12 stop:206 length:195 start_codon:yes stop_codon:yes gene_type:complete
MDVLSSSEGDNKVACYENIDGQGDFGDQQIATQRQITLRRVSSSVRNAFNSSILLCLKIRATKY